MVWLRVVEEYLVRALLQSPAFHSMVRNFHGQVHGFRADFLPHFKQALRDQIRLDVRQQTRAVKPGAAQKPLEAAKADHKAIPPGFLSYFVEELKKQAGMPGKR